MCLDQGAQVWHAITAADYIVGEEVLDKGLQTPFHRVLEHRIIPYRGPYQSCGPTTGNGGYFLHLLTLKLQRQYRLPNTKHST